jgi:soluble lytic murein transglycosylase-like protein
MIREAEVRYGLPTRLLQALIWTESRFDPLAISPAGAAGLAQLMPATAHELGVVNWHDPAESIDGGARYLRQMLDRFGAIHLALAAYNAGPGRSPRPGASLETGRHPDMFATSSAAGRATTSHSNNHNCITSRLRTLATCQIILMPATDEWFRRASPAVGSSKSR